MAEKYHKRNICYNCQSSKNEYKINSSIVDLENRERRNNVHMKRIKEEAKKEGLAGLTGWI